VGLLASVRGRIVTVVHFLSGHSLVSYYYNQSGSCTFNSLTASGFSPRQDNPLDRDIRTDNRPINLLTQLGRFWL
jgi:hypothetical protein